MTTTYTDADKAYEFAVRVIDMLGNYLGCEGDIHLDDEQRKLMSELAGDTSWNYGLKTDDAGVQSRIRAALGGN